MYLCNTTSNYLNMAPRKQPNSTSSAPETGQKSTIVESTTKGATKKQPPKQGMKTGQKKESEQARTTIKKERFLAALEKCQGNITLACNESGVGRTSVYEWKAKDPDFVDAMETVTEQVFDFVESKIMQQIAEGNTAVLIFFAKTKMKSRGYVERQEIAVSETPSFVVKGSNKGTKAMSEFINELRNGKPTQPRKTG